MIGDPAEGAAITGNDPGSLTATDERGPERPPEQSAGERGPVVSRGWTSSVPGQGGILYWHSWYAPMSCWERPIRGTTRPGTLDVRFCDGRVGRGVASDPSAFDLPGAPRRAGGEVGGLPGRLVGDAGKVPCESGDPAGRYRFLNQSATRSLDWGHALLSKVAESNRLLAVRAESTRTDLAAGPAAVRAPLLAQVASSTAATFVDGEHLRCAPGLGR